MLGKLLKYEFIATSRFFLIAYPALIVLSFLNHFLFGTGSSRTFGPLTDDSIFYQILSIVSVFVYAGLVFGVFIGCTIMMIQRFYKNMLGDEGYLMNTLPVSPWQHIVAKMLTCAVWLFCSILVTLASVMILAWEIPDISGAFREMTNALLLYGASPSLVYTEFALMSLFSLLTFMLPFYASIMLGQFWKKHRVLGAILAYIGLTTVGQMIAGGMARQWFRHWSRLSEVAHYGSYSLSNEEFFGQAFHSLMVPAILLNIAGAAVLFLITHFLLERRLNLE